MFIVVKSKQFISLILLLLLLQTTLSKDQTKGATGNGSMAGADDTGFPQSEKGRGRVFNSESNLDCRHDVGSTVVEKAPNPTPNCFSYRVPVCEDGKYDLISIWTVEGSTSTDFKQCYNVKIHDEVVQKATYTDLLDTPSCPRIEISINMKVDKKQTELKVGKNQIFPVQNGEFPVSICFSKCGREADKLETASISMMKKGGAKGLGQPCKVADSSPEYHDCPAEIYEDAPRCPPSNTYLVNTDGVTCQVTLTSTNDNCFREEINKTTESEALGGRWSTSRTRSGCNPDPGPIVIEKAPNPTPTCFSYRVPLCQDSAYTLKIWNVGDTDAYRLKMCNDVRINEQVISQVLYFNMLGSNRCPRTEVHIKLQVDKDQTELKNNRVQIIPIQNKEFLLSACFTKCENVSGTLQVSKVIMDKVGGSEAKHCTVGEVTPAPTEGPSTETPRPGTTTTTTKAPEPPPEPSPDCRYYTENIPSVCWSHGCQYYLNGKQRCAAGTMSCETRNYNCICSHNFCDHLDIRKCKPDRAIFKNKLTCRRANTYYVYHPKQHCYNPEDSGDCTATAIYAVNLNGEAVKDKNGISYVADKDSYYRDPHGTRNPDPLPCKFSDQLTMDVYSPSIVGNHNPKIQKSGKCISYPIPICQTGEYKLTIKITDSYHGEINQRCTEVRINNVPIMIHLDTVRLADGKCMPADIAVMFLATNGDDQDPKSNRRLYLKGHDEPIEVIGGELELQFCYGYDCRDINYHASAFVLERFGGGTNECKLDRRNFDCKGYAGNNPSQCYIRGCQHYFKDGDNVGRCINGMMSCETNSADRCICSHNFCDDIALAADNCIPDSPIFKNKLTCRRANTYYVYHPKQHCYNVNDSGDCTATVIHAVNLNGPALTDINGISYIADKDSGYDDPYGSRTLDATCPKVFGVGDQNTMDLYMTAIYGKYGGNRAGQCIRYPVKICQRGEYMLTVKSRENYYSQPNARCTEVRINLIPVMIHLDPFVLSGNRKCGTADAV